MVIDQNVLLRNVVDSATEVFSTMLGIEVELSGEAADTKAPELGIISLVGITGDWGGSGVFCCTPVLASVICARMLGTDLNPGSPSIDEEVLDVVAEITNMMIGNIKNGLEGITGPLAISVPTVIHGRNFKFRNSFGLRGVTIAFKAEGEVFEVRISLAPVPERPPARFRIPVLGLSQI
jgi:CheY-specific phosphatase CheX